MSVVLYGAGNFVLMSSPEKEKKFVQELLKRDIKCNRLISFFFKKELDVVMGVKKNRTVLKRRKK